MTTPVSKNLITPVKNDATWSSWDSYSQTNLHARIAPLSSQDNEEALFLKIDRPENYARWNTRIHDLTPGGTYEFSVLQKITGTDFISTLHAPIILGWHDAENAETPLQRDYVDKSTPLADGWVRRFREINIPSTAVSVGIALGLRGAAGVEIIWRDPQLHEVASCPPRKVRIATTRIYPPEFATVEGNTQAMAEMFDLVGKENPDIVLFSENLVDRHVRQPLAKNAQPIPGPLTDMLSEKARFYGTYVVTTLHEVDDKGLFYNTAVLIDRQGNLLGKYRKVHLTMTELEDGIIPGNDYPVFDTDFGRIGILICWNNWFPETARTLSLQGAEILLLPIAGDGVPGHWDAISKARALDNSIYLVTSATETDNPSCIINPAGETVGEATGTFGYVVKEVDMNQEWHLRWLSVGAAAGEAKSLYREERRPDTYQILRQE